MPARWERSTLGAAARAGGTAPSCARHTALLFCAALAISTAKAAPMRAEASGGDRLAAAATAPEGAPSEPAAINAVDSVAVSVGDLDRSVEFYSQVLEFRQDSDRKLLGESYERLFGLFGVRLRVAGLRLGDERLELMEFVTPRGRRVPPDLHSNDRAFQHVAIVVSDMRAAYARLQSFSVQHASTAPQRLPDSNPNAGGIEAFYFRDPDGHYLELLAFPPDKGAAKWHAADGRLFLGIDHTAIVVSDTDASLRFYRDVLGLRIAGSSENFGIEQEHLNSVLGAHLRITSLRAAQGPGIELLEYLAPRSGRAAPADTVPDDLWYWQINLRSQDPKGLEHRLRGARAPLVSSQVTHLHDRTLGFTDGVIVRDPDGHASLIER
jgi:catechol 2,3-dioxygenase-like lactoylglutathione lyase family enzyme